MTSWTDGYVTEIAYTYGYYRELAPTILKFAATVAGSAAGRPQDKITFCELGCGQGLSANIIGAANSKIEVHATDFNASQIAGARQLAHEAGLDNVHFYDSAFDEFAAEPSLPRQFDIIVLHGIYSWISAENRRHIVSFMRQRLRPGGIVYISYNTFPGWSSVMPLRRLLVDQAAVRKGVIAHRVSEALAFAEALKATGAAYFQQNPALSGRLDKMKGMQREYLAHEYFNADWTPFYFADVAAELAEAKLSFVCSAHLLDHIDAVNFTSEQQTLLAEIDDPIRRQGLRDYIINQQFRRDIFVKGDVPLSVPEARVLWGEYRFALTASRDDVSLKATGALGEADLQAEVYVPILDSLTEGPATFTQLVADKKIADLGWRKVMQALAVLVGTGNVQPCAPLADEATRTQRTQHFNAAVLKRAEYSSNIQFLASPVTGGGVAIDRVGQLFLAAISSNDKDPAKYAWDVLSAQGHLMVRDGQPLNGEEANLAELRLRFHQFSTKRLPVLKQLGIA